MKVARPIFLFTDFSRLGPYVGQLHAVIAALNPGLRVFDLMHDAPQMRPDLAAWLLPPFTLPLPGDAVILAVVDPGVGGRREALIVEAGGRSFVGPDNGLLARLPGITGVSRILWRPDGLSNSFHGRDLFAPVAARLALGRAVNSESLPVPVPTRSGDERARVVYVDAYGNLMTNLDPAAMWDETALRLAGVPVPHAGTFCEVPSGTPFWYVNSQRMVEIACREDSASRRLALALGDELLLD